MLLLLMATLIGAVVLWLFRYNQNVRAKAIQYIVLNLRAGGSANYWFCPHVYTFGMEFISTRNVLSLN